MVTTLNRQSLSLLGKQEKKLVLIVYTILLLWCLIFYVIELEK